MREKRYTHAHPLYTPSFPRELPVASSTRRRRRRHCRSSRRRRRRRRDAKVVTAVCAVSHALSSARSPPDDTFTSRPGPGEFALYFHHARNHVTRICYFRLAHVTLSYPSRFSFHRLLRTIHIRMLFHHALLVALRALFKEKRVRPNARRKLSNTTGSSRTTGCCEVNERVVCM